MKFFVHYIFAMLYFQTNGTCSGLAKTIKGISHDSFTRFLKQEWSGQKRLEHFIEPECIDGGYLIIDDTPIEKPHSKTLEGLSWVYSSTMGDGCIRVFYCRAPMDRRSNEDSYWAEVVEARW